jgi:prolyl-tRNA editing enzyme YbaK/EbsC (Cys-tRNA(Pro) deacylase)
MEHLHPSCQAVNAVLEAAGLAGRVRILDRPATTAQAAADQLGCEVGAIANSLIFAADTGEPWLIMTSGGHCVDLAKVGAGYGVQLKRASADFVRAHTGQPIGGVAPVAHPQPIRTLVDRALAAYAVLWAAGGIPHAVFPLSYPELVRLTSGEEADVN